ncbi:hypothetical protein CathTA2_2376 [Caldalkalibacillus thermarum TA2.A1]|uniref:Uncharacterized protein n=1 Tax=Caldalkalibacillus thermarum (strain TA2.A1) TaxID=986075 RepID=F5L967_CALTT|nr:hypothetical protein CathTA2_2376 [Caldalkalibacillus thermarum TA2.A1]
MNEVLLSLLVGMVVGFLFTLLKLPLPRPASAGRRHGHCRYLCGRNNRTKSIALLRLNVV